MWLFDLQTQRRSAHRDNPAPWWLTVLKKKNPQGSWAGSNQVFHFSVGSLRGEKMSPLRTGYVPRCGSQQGSSQRDESQTDQTMDQTEPSSQCPGPNKRGRKRARGEKSRSVLKVKLPNLRCSTLSKTTTDGDKAMGRTEPNASKTDTTLSRGENQCNVALHVLI